MKLSEIYIYWAGRGGGLEGDGKAGWLAGLDEFLFERGFIIYSKILYRIGGFFGT